MNALEGVAIDKVRGIIFSIIDRCHEKNEHRMEHERTFIRSDANDALELINALQENDKTMRKTS